MIFAAKITNQPITGTLTCHGTIRRPGRSPIIKSSSNIMWKPTTPGMVYFMTNWLCQKINDIVKNYLVMPETRYLKFTKLLRTTVLSHYGTFSSPKRPLHDLLAT